jgi:lipocalin
VDFGFGFAAPYDIVERDDDAGEAPYAFAAVSSFDGAQLWILAREPSMEADFYEALVTRLEARGYEDPRGRMERTEQATGE